MTIYGLLKTLSESSSAKQIIKLGARSRARGDQLPGKQWAGLHTYIYKYAQIYTEIDRAKEGKKE